MEVEGEMQVKQEERAMRMEHRMRAARAPNQPRIKTERFDDDSRREGRQTERVGAARLTELTIRDWKEEWTKSLTTMSTMISRMTRRITRSTGTRMRKKRPNSRM
jgi:hypothetical protein